MCFFGHGASGTQGSRQKSYEVELMGLCSASTDALAESAVAAAVCPDGAADFGWVFVSALASVSGVAWSLEGPSVWAPGLASVCVTCPRGASDWAAGLASPSAWAWVSP